MKKSPKILLEYILESIEELEEHVKKSTKASFINDTKTQDAAMRRIEIIGEAARSLPSEFKRKNPKISWHEISGMRNKLVHEYMDIDLDLVWEVIKKDIPKLKKKIEGMI